MRLLLTLALPLVGWLASISYTLFTNYQAARKTGLPVVVVYVSPSNPLWMLSWRFVMPVVKRLPFVPATFLRFGYTGWESTEKYRSHETYGDAFILVTPGKNWVYLCNADAVSDIIQRERRHDFSRPVELLAVLDVFGPNLSTCEGADWQRQRKCTAASFNERNNRTVWAESIRQAREMLLYWQTSHPSGVSSIADDVRTFTLHVLLAAGFGKSYPYRSSALKKPGQSGPQSYRESLALILQNAVLIVAMGPQLLSRFARLRFPKRLARLGDATDAFQRYMANMLEEEKQLIAAGRAGDDNLMTALVRASAEQKEGGLTRDEVFGNMFVFNFAGHDSTAHTLAYTLVQLAAHPGVQAWMAEEIKHVLPEEDDGAWTYERFARMNRTLAVFFETLRLYDPLLSIMKQTLDAPTPLAIGSHGTVVIPPRTNVILSIQALHSHPRYWGHDSLEWRPERWITVRPGPGPQVDREELITPSKGSFIPFSEGSRACPGRKFAQVEHCGAMASLFRRHRVVPVRRAGEGAEEAQKRVGKVAEDVGMVLLLQMMHPERAVVEWKRVG